MAPPFLAVLTAATEADLVLDAFFDNYPAYEFAVASAQLFLAMLGMGALLAPRDFLLEIRNPRGLVVGLGFQWALVPLVAMVLGLLMPVPAGIAVGLILIASVPGGTLSNILTLFGRGNIALSVSLTSITTVGSLVMTPLLLQLLVSQHLPAGFSMPVGALAADILLTLILPLLVGMAVRQYAHAVFAANFSKWMIRASLCLVVVVAVGAGGSGRLDPEAYGLAGMLALVLFSVLVQVTGFVACRAAGLRGSDILAVVVEVSFRNMSLAVAVKAVVFPAQTGVLDPIGDAVLFSALLYGGLSMFLSLPPVMLNRRLVQAPA
jgi:BASS family bile acid:Na+ symporter